MRETMNGNLEDGTMKLPGNLGRLLLCALLILWGLVLVAELTFKFRDLVLGCLAIAAGVLMLLDR
jgi:hypothetical protein